MARCLNCVVLTRKKRASAGLDQGRSQPQQGDTRPVWAWQVDFMVDRLSGEVGGRKKFLGARVTIVLRRGGATPGGGAGRAGGRRAVRRWPALAGRGPGGQLHRARKWAALPYIGSGHKRAGERVCAIRCVLLGRQGSSRPAAPCHRAPRPRPAPAAGPLPPAPRSTGRSGG